MNRKKNKLLNEKGIIGADIAIATLIVMLFAALIIAGLYQSYETSNMLAASSLATTNIVRIFEKIDAMDYDNVTVDTLNTLPAQLGIGEGYVIHFEVNKYSDTESDTEFDKLDVIKTVKIKIQYTVGSKAETIEMSKLKVKES